MKAITLDKIASVTANCHLHRDVKVGDEYPCQEGDVVAVKVLTSKSSYNTLELTTGRMSPLNSGDIIAGCLGHRHATQGHAGHVPKELATGDRIQLLNLGGVLGVCTSSSPAVGAPFECEVLGQVLDFPYLAQRVGVPANIRREVAELDEKLNLKAPVIAVIGTSMNSGKTEACLRLIQGLVRSGLKVAAAKTTGVSLRRDILAMEDAGAWPTSIFTDFGVVTTQSSNGPGLVRSMLNKLAASDPDVIVVELGDGLFGSYGVDAILNSEDFKSCLAAVVLAATDPVAAWGGVRSLEADYGLKPHVITGPATDNEVGVGIIQQRTGVVGINARTDTQAMTDMMLGVVEKANV